jgi:hypothetical protein
MLQPEVAEMKLISQDEEQNIFVFQKPGRRIGTLVVWRRGE